MEEKEIHDELSAIRNLMERSSKFISLSGLSGILAGVYALIGIIMVYVVNGSLTIYQSEDTDNNPQHLVYILFILLVVLILSIATALILSSSKAKRKGQPLWGKISQSMLFHMATPLLAGGILILILVYRGYYGTVLPCSLIFYGLALVSASNFTFNMVKYLGLCEIALGLIAACLPGYGLLFWAFGFGVLHIVYGSMMYLKYDR